MKTIKKITNKSVAVERGIYAVEFTAEVTISVPILAKSKEEAEDIAYDMESGLSADVSWSNDEISIYSDFKFAEISTDIDDFQFNRVSTICVADDDDIDLDEMNEFLAEAGYDLFEDIEAVEEEQVEDYKDWVLNIGEDIYSLKTGEVYKVVGIYGNVDAGDYHLKVKSKGNETIYIDETNEENFHPCQFETEEEAMDRELSEEELDLKAEEAFIEKAVAELEELERLAEEELLTPQARREMHVAMATAEADAMEEEDYERNHPYEEEEEDYPTDY